MRGGQEREAPKNPYELAGNAGYELAGPFEGVDELTPYEQDYRNGELICTFTTNPESRLDTYHILWLRSEEVDFIVPADELTEENLTETWRKYLRAINRYDASTGIYNLVGLRPSREDPYGVSSMSVQISRMGKHVSIKNRYNHTVASPDSTYGNNLNNIIHGLKLAIYDLVGRVDLMDADQEQLDVGYVLDNDGGIHYYYYEEDNVYLGHYEYIKNGVVHSIDKGAYDMISPDIYVSKCKKGKTIAIGDTVRRTSLEAVGDDRFNLHTYNSSGDLDRTYNYGYDEKGNTGEVCLRIARMAEIRDIAPSPVLSRLTVSEGAMAGQVYHNPLLTEIRVDKYAVIEDIFGNPELTKVTVAEKARIGDVDLNTELAEVVIAEGATTGNISGNSALESLNIGNGAITGSVIRNQLLAELTVSESAVVGQIHHNQSLAKLTVAGFAKVGNIFRNQALNELAIARYAAVGDVLLPGLNVLTIAEGAAIGDILENLELSELNIAENVTAGDIVNNPALAKITIGRGAEVGTIAYNPGLIELTMANRATVGRVGAGNHPEIVVQYIERE